MTIVLYHGPGCPDGFCAAWVASLALGRGPDVAYLPVNYGQPYPSAIDDGVDRLFILDFSYPRSTLDRLASKADETVVLDHHATAAKELEGVPYARFDMDRSGAMLAWDHFHPGRPAPALVRYVQDRDLWRWELPNSKAFSAALSLEPRDFQAWTDLSDAIEREAALLDHFIEEGRTILAHTDHLVGRLAASAYMISVLGHRVPAVNSPLFQSEVGERLCRDHPDAPFAAVYSANGPDEETWSLRSRDGFDVSAVAKSLGGGGHPAAAGFRAISGRRTH